MLVFANGCADPMIAPTHSLANGRDARVQCVCDALLVELGAPDCRRYDGDESNRQPGNESLEHIDMYVRRLYVK